MLPIHTVIYSMYEKKRKEEKKKKKKKKKTRYNKVTVNPNTRYEHSTLNSCLEICDENYTERKKSVQMQAILYSMIQKPLATQTFYLEQLLRNLLSHSLLHVHGKQMWSCCCCVPILLTTFPLEPQRNVSIAAVRGAVRPSKCGHVGTSTS